MLVGLYSLWLPVVGTACSGLFRLPSRRITKRRDVLASSALSARALMAPSSERKMPARTAFGFMSPPIDAVGFLAAPGSDPNERRRRCYKRTRCLTVSVRSERFVKQWLRYSRAIAI